MKPTTFHFPVWMFHSTKFEGSNCLATTVSFSLVPQPLHPIPPVSRSKQQRHQFVPCNGCSGRSRPISGHTKQCNSVGPCWGWPLVGLPKNGGISMEYLWLNTRSKVVGPTIIATKRPSQDRAYSIWWMTLVGKSSKRGEVYCLNRWYIYTYTGPYTFTYNIVSCNHMCIYIYIYACLYMYT